MNDYQDILATTDCFEYMLNIRYVDNTWCVVIDEHIVFSGTHTECYNYCKNNLE